MDLRLMEITSFGSDLDVIERAAEQPGNRLRHADYVMTKWMVVWFLAALGLTVVEVTAGWLPFLISTAVCLAMFWKHKPTWEERCRRLTLAAAGPQSRAFLEVNWFRRVRLLKAASAYNLTLDGLRTLSSGGDAESQLGLAESMRQRRLALDQDTDAYLLEYRAATADDRGRFAAMAEEYESRAKALPPPDDTLDVFNRKVDRLMGLEAALDHLQSAADAGTTVDLTPFVAARRIREELETERERLIARGLKPKRLPVLRVSPKFLTTST